MGEEDAPVKGHRVKQAGAKANKRKLRDKQKKGLDKGQINLKVSKCIKPLRATMYRSL